MPFDLQIWKDKLHDKLIGLDLKAQALERKTLYGVVAASALLPVVTAAQSGDPAALMAAGQVLAGSVGVGLLTNLLQKKQDGIDAEWSIVNPTELAAQAQANPELLATLDDMLQKLDALALARNSLPEAERAWFTKALKQELEKLGNASTYNLTLEGDVAIALGAGAVALGKGAVYVGGKNKGNINTGTQIRTGGGAYVAGDVHAQGDFVGRDKIVNNAPASAGDLEPLFAMLLAAVSGQAPADKQAAATAAVQQLKTEASKGKAADDSRMAKIVDGLAGMVPGAVGALVAAFANPVLAGVAGPVTQFVLDKLKGR